MSKKPAILYFLFCQFLSQSSFGTVSNISVPNYLNQTIAGTAVTIYAGRADPNNVAPNSASDTPYDTCASIATFPATATACNQNSVFSNLSFTVTLATDNAGPYTTASKVVMVNGSSKIDGTLVGTTAIAQGQTVTATFRWGAICGMLDPAGSSTCDNSFSQSAQIGISKDGTSTMVDYFTLQVNFRSIIAGNASLAFHTNCSATQDATANEGVCGFTVKPGDAKAIFGNVYIPLQTDGSQQNSWPSPGDNSGVKFAGVKVYYRPTADQNTEPPASAEYQAIAPGAAGTYEADLAIGADGAMSQTRVTGLSNETLYVFSIATYDQAGNITNFSDLNTASMFYTTDTHYGRPGEVVGLLSNKKCFIATAAFGSEMAPQVELLRQFRNEFLLKSHLGKKFVQTYYQLSPPVAEFIAKHDSIRAVVRWTLSPVIGWAQFCLEFGIVPGVLLLLVLGLLGREIFRRTSMLLQWQRSR